MTIQCGYIAEGEAKAAVFFREALRESSLNQVQYRFDDGETETETWETSPNSLAVLASAPSEFIWKLMNSEKLVVGEEDGQTLTFDVEGLSTALYSHRDKCDWIGVGTLGKKANRPTSTSSPTATARPIATARPTNPPAPAPQPTSTPLSRVGGAPLPEEFTGGEEIAATASTSEMMGIGANGLSGTLHLIQIERQTKVMVTLDNAGPGPYAAVIRRGGCPDEGGEPGGQFEYILFDVVDGGSISMVNTPAQSFQFSLAYLIVVDGEDLVNDPLISCGNIPSPLR